MLIVIDGRVYDPTKQPILVVLNYMDIDSIRTTTLPANGDTAKPLAFFECPVEADGPEMEALSAAWEEAVRQHIEEQDSE